jgi:hypothetical protein
VKRILFSIYFILFYIILGYGQSVFSGAENGIGLRNYTTTNRGMGMGNTGLALADSISLNTYNAATWRHITNTKISISARYDYVYTDLVVQNFSSSRTNFSGLHLAIPIQKNKWIMGLSLVPYSIVNFSYILNFKNQEIEYSTHAFYEGNISRAQFNLTWAPDQRLGFSANFLYFFGKIEDKYLMIFDEPNYSDSYYNIEYRIQGPGFGMSFDFEPKDKLRLGGFVDLPVRTNYSKVYFSPITEEEKKNKEKAIIPIFWGIGVAYQLQSQWFLSTDFAYQNWSNGLDLEESNPDNLDKWYKIGFGIERSCNPIRPKALLNKFDIRTGISYGNMGYIFNNSLIDEYAFHLGFGIPFYQGYARLDLAFCAGIRGDKSKNLLEEKFFKLDISLSAGELWFQKIR